MTTCPALSAGAIAGRLAEEITGKLQSKALSGDTLALGIATARGGAGAARSRGPGGTVSGRARSGCRSGSGPELRARRRVSVRRRGRTDEVTVDLDRHLFHVDRDGRVAPLGQLGPRIEIKGPTHESVETMRRVLDPQGLIRRQPNRSLELLFQDMLRRRVRPAPTGSRRWS